MRVDLRDVELPAGRTDLPLELGVGEIQVLVPDDLCVSPTPRSRSARSTTVDGRAGRRRPRRRPTTRARAGTRAVRLDVDLGVGAVRVGDRCRATATAPTTIGTLDEGLEPAPAAPPARGRHDAAARLRPRLAGRGRDRDRARPASCCSTRPTCSTCASTTAPGRCSARSAAILLACGLAGPRAARRVRTSASWPRQTRRPGAAPPPTAPARSSPASAPGSRRRLGVDPLDPARRLRRRDGGGRRRHRALRRSAGRCIPADRAAATRGRSVARARRGARAGEVAGGIVPARPQRAAPLPRLGPLVQRRGRVAARAGGGGGALIWRQSQRAGGGRAAAREQARPGGGAGRPRRLRARRARRSGSSRSAPASSSARALVFLWLNGALVPRRDVMLAVVVVVVALTLIARPVVAAARARADRGARRADPLPGARRGRRAPARLRAADARADAEARRRPARGRRARPPPGARAARVAQRTAAERSRGATLAARARGGAVAEVEDAHGVPGRRRRRRRPPARRAPARRSWRPPARRWSTR